MEGLGSFGLLGISFRGNWVGSTGKEERVNKCMSIVPSWLGKYNRNRYRHVCGAKGRERVEY